MMPVSQSDPIMYYVLGFDLGIYRHLKWDLDIKKLPFEMIQGAENSNGHKAPQNIIIASAGVTAAYRY